MNGSLLVCLGLLAGFSFSVCKAEKPVEAIAFGSCLKQTRPQPIWESVRASKPDVFVLLGDNIYGDTRDMEKLKSRWATFGAFPEFKKLRSDCRLLAIWDDHDYGENDAGREFPQKAESQQIFLDFLGEPKDSERRKTPGIYDSVTIGPKGKRVQFILLDTRYFRSPLKRRQKRKGQGSLWAERIGSGRNSRRNPMEVVGENFAQTGRSPHHRIQYSSCFNHSRLGNLGKLSQRTETFSRSAEQDQGQWRDHP